MPHRHTQVFETVAKPQVVSKTKNTHTAFDRIRFIHRFISDLTFSSRQRLHQTWPSQLLDIWSGTTCWQIPKCRPGPTWSFWESVLPDWNAVRSCPLRNTLLSQLWCVMICTLPWMDTWTHDHQTTKKKTTFFVLFQGGKWFMTLCYSSLSKCGATLRPEYIHWDGVLGGRDSGPRHKDSVFFRCGTESDSGCLQSKRFRYLIVYVLCGVLLLRLLAMSRIFFCFITVDATWDGYADIAMRQEGTLTGEHLPNKAIQLFSKGAYPFFVWHIIRNSLKLFPILSFPVLSHDTAEDWEDHVEIACHKVTDLHGSNPARTQATENIPQPGDGVQGGHAADGNPDSVKVASQALVGWKFLQLMFFWLWILLVISSYPYWFCPGTYCSAGSHAVCNAKKETAKTKNGYFLVAGNLKQRTAFQRWTCWSQRCFENLEGEKTQRSLCNWVWESLLLAWRHPNFGRLQTKIAMSKVSTGKRLILFFELSLFWSRSWAQRFNQIYAWSTGSSWIGGLAKVWVLFTVLSSWALLSIMTGVVSDNMLEVGSSWNIMEPYGCEMVRWWDDHVSCVFPPLGSKTFAGSPTPREERRGKGRAPSPGRQDDPRCRGSKVFVFGKMSTCRIRMRTTSDPVTQWSIPRS